MSSKICRVCLNKTATISLFDKQGDIQYCTKLIRCVNVVVQEGDGFPDMICPICAEELCTSYEFVNKCEASDKVLRNANIADLVDIIPKVELEVIFEHIKDEVPLDDSDNFNDEFTQQDNSYVEYFASENTDDHCEGYQVKRPTNKYTKRTVIDGRSLRAKLGVVRCTVCSYLAASPSALEGHMRTHTGEKPFICHYCDAGFKLKGALRRHITTHLKEREKNFMCETCGKSFVSKNSIITHIRVHTDEKPYTCPFCPKMFKQIASMIRHKRLHTGEKPFSCPICFKKFIDKSHMNRHQTVHSKEKKFSCHVCNKFVKTKNALKTHMKTHSNEKHNICNYCGMTFSLKGNLQIHIRRIHSEKSGECNVCLKTFPDLEAHMRRHTGEKPFVCKLCNQAFINQRSLSHHIGFKHNNSSKYKCSIGECMKSFPKATMLEFHLLKHHSNHTPYVCVHCSRGFFRTSDLSRHLKISHMDTKNINRLLS